MVELNLLDPDFLADPYPIYHRLRTEIRSIATLSASTS
jgi:hypothetical protein